MKKSLLLASLSVSALSFTQMTMTSSTMLVPGVCDCYQLTPNAINDAGAVWSPQSINLTQSFDMTFSFYAGAADGADGLAFVLQQNASGLGDVGATLGYSDVPPLTIPSISAKSLMIEVDTWNSNPAVPSDINSDHLGVAFNGDNNHNLSGPHAIANVENGAYHTFRVVWNPSLTALSAIVDGIPVFVYTGDIITNVFTGNPVVYFGWTAATGGVGNEHRVCMYRNAAFTTSATSVCPVTPVNFTSTSTSNLNNITDYSWNFGDGSPVVTTQNASHTYAAAGTYTAELIIEDISGCTDNATVNITVLPDLSVTMSGNDVSCFGDVDGDATATPTSGTGPYSYAWDDLAAQTTQTATALVPGTYNVDVTDNLGCTGTGSFTVNEPALFSISINRLNATCFDSNDGSAQVVTSNGVGPFSYDWDDPNDQTTQIATGLGAGAYNVTVTDANGCIATAVATINAPTEMFITGAVTYDNGTSNGSIDASVTGGTTPYATTSWSNSAITEDITGLSAGSYTLTVTDDNGCQKDTTFIVPSSVGMDDLTAIGFEIYPNPTTGILNVKGSGYYAVVITDAAGRIVVNVDATGNSTIDLSAFERGIYFVTVEKEGVKYVQRVSRQ